MRRGFDGQGVSFVLKGYGWSSKDGREKVYRAKRSAEMGRKMREAHQKSEMVPNYNGEPTESWREARELAKKGGKNSRSYDNKVEQERTGSSQISTV